jgi:hypothetical protein
VAVGRPTTGKASLGSGNYQPVILMEFIGAILLTAVTPIATKTEADGLSPYAGKDMVKLGAITVLYLILAAVSVTGQTAGRIAMWLGGLILLTDGLYEASNIVTDLDLFAGIRTAASNAASSTGSAASGAAVGLENSALVQQVANAALNPFGSKA